ncbi:ABC transporter substrate-binding protein [Thiohalocapsa marina]|uniref:ABC transporter substrate-binding protein n=1 Tax=Thiohalocapsa marina TaxID=424902 RepID=A0A5M8FTD4_9GAMM|nr:ABC transporter substrate-binding protein [Thiohalocapsa marina]
MATAPTAAWAELPRVASTNLCADLLLLQIAAPEQIVSVSRQSQDSPLSPVAEQARSYPPNRGGVEDLLYRSPDMALVYQGWTGRRHAELLSEQGIAVIPLPYPQTWDEALAITRQVAARIGRQQAAESVIADAEARLRTLGARPRPYRVLYLRPSGGTAGSGTYVDDLLQRLGVRNHAADLGHAGWGRLPLESLVGSPPDVFLLGYFESAQPSTQAAYGRHPLLRRLLERIPSITVPTTVWGCGGLELVTAAEHIAARLDELDQLGRPQSR